MYDSFCAAQADTWHVPAACNATGIAASSYYATHPGSVAPATNCRCAPLPCSCMAAVAMRQQLLAAAQPCQHLRWPARSVSVQLSLRLRSVVSTGNVALEYWGLSIAPGEVIGILLCFYIVLHVASFLALSQLHKQKR